MKGDALKPSMILLATTIVVLLAALWRHYQPPDRDLAFPAGEIVIGVDGSFPPYAFDAGGALAGLDVELGAAIAAEIGLPVRFVNLSFYGLYDALITGEVDLLMAALRVDPARMDDVRYTRPYFDNGLVLVTASFGVPLNGAAQTGTALAFEYASGADSQIRAWEQEGQSFARMPYELPTHALDALRLGQTDAALVDASTLHLYAKEHAEWDYRREFVTRELYAIALRINRDDAWKLVDSALGALKERGELAKIVDRWF
ncbi:MAG: ABC transporter substrate-binding protein [Chloroflexi bacterium]|nr:ABC transporter substrate-binding protein [Chloroflexota bacterium]